MAKSPGSPEMTDAQAALGSPPLNLPPQQKVLTPEQRNPRKRASPELSKEAPPAKRTKSGGSTKVAKKPERTIRTFKRVTTVQKPAPRAAKSNKYASMCFLPSCLLFRFVENFRCAGRVSRPAIKKSIVTPQRPVTRSYTQRSLRSGAKRSTKKLTIPSEFNLSTSRRTTKKTDK